MTATPADDLSLAAQVDTACDRFESEFRAGQRPRLEAFLEDVKEPNRARLFQSLLEVELELRQSQGKSFRAEDYSARFPEYLPIIDEAIQRAREFPGKRSSVIITGVETSRGPAAGAVNLPPANVSLPLSTIGRFQVVALLGEGAFGSVYKAHDPQLDREVAIKVPRSVSHRSDEERERFLREGRAAAALHHPNICPVYEVGTTPEGRDYIVMAFIEGRPLSRVLQASQRLTDRQIVNAIRRLALALEEAHAKGIIHRDLKPANIMINRKGEPVIMDFGLARRATATDAQLSHSGQIMGTPAYMSPEQARGDIKGVGPLSDLYSLGLVMYEMLCGRRPFEGTITEVIGQILHVEPPPPSQFRKEIDPHLESICLKAIAKRPDDRFASMKDFATALSQYATTMANAKPGAASSAKDALGSGDPLHTEQLAKLVAAVSSDVESKINRAAGRMVRQASLFGGVGRPPLWVSLAGSGFMGLVVLLGILFFVRAGDTTILIQVPLPPGVDLKDTSLAFFLDDRPIPAEQIGQPLELSPGDHELVIKRGDQVVERMRFEVVKEGKNWNIAKRDANSPPPAVAPFSAEEAREHQEAWAKHLGVPVEFTNSIGMKFRLIPPGEYSRGTPADEYESVLPTWNNDPWLTQCLESETPVHRVKLTRPFYLGTHEVTQRQYEQMVSTNPSEFSASGESREKVAGKDTSDFPVERVNWDEALEFCNRLSQSESLTSPKVELRAGELSLSAGDGYRLPTEAEWEYACRAGTTSRFWSGESAQSLDQAGWYSENSEQRMHAVGELRPNPFGLFDIHGNAWEWVQDWWNKDSYKPFAETPAVDPLGAAMGSGQPLRVVRGGFMGYGPNWSRSAHRNGFAANTRFGFIGFRVVVSVDGVKKLLSAPHQKTNLASDWTALFNGKNLAGWQGATDAFEVADGVLKSIAGRKGTLYSVPEYDDFALKLEFRISPGANNGLAIRYPGTGDPAHEGMCEIQIIDAAIPIDDPRQRLGSAYGLAAAQNTSLRPAGEWNEQIVTVRGSKVQVELNGSLILDTDLATITETAFNRPHPGKGLTKGHVGFFAMSGVAEFRKIGIKRLTPDSPSGSDLSRWQGRWQCVAENSWGKVVYKDDRTGMGPVQIISGNQRELSKVSANNKIPVGLHQFRIDETASPKTFDCDEFPFGDDKFRQSGIYEFVGDRLRLVYRFAREKQPVRATWADIGQSDVHYYEFERSTDSGFASLFNGKDLAGWKVSGPADWSVRDGAVFVDGSKSGELTCERPFDDFELTGEVYATAKGNGAVQFRLSSKPINNVLGFGGYEFQVAGSQADPGKNYTGGLYEGGQTIVRVNPPVAGDGIWSTIRLRVEGNHLQGWVNDRLTFDVRGKPERLGGRLLKLNSFAQGGEVGYRNFRIRPLATTSESGWVSLFNGKDLAGWRMPPGSPGNPWKVENGILTAEPGSPPSMLVTDRGDFRDVHVRAEAMIESGVGGIKTRTLSMPNPFQVGYTINLAGREISARDASPANPSLPADKPLVSSFNPPPNKWVTLEIIVRGFHVKVLADGNVIDEYDDLLQRRTSGHIGLPRGPATRISFRKIEVKELPPETVAPVPAGTGWVPLFNGKDLAGWRMPPNGPANPWKVENGILTAETGLPMSMLLTERGDYGDVHIRATAKFGGGRAGIKVRTPIDLDPHVGSYTLAMYDASPPPERGPITAFKPPLDTWLTLEMIVRGYHVKVLVDGKVIDEYDDNTRLRAAGHIALPRSPNGKVSFRKIEVMEFSSDATKQIPGDARTFNGHSYKFFPEQLSWKEAKARCEAMGGRLAMVESLEENNFVSGLVAAAGKVDAWIGATDEGSEGQWRWVDGHLMTWTNWFKEQSQPNNKGGVEHFGLMSNMKLPNGKTIGWHWSDQPNESTQHQPGYVCEWE